MTFQVSILIFFFSIHPPSQRCLQLLPCHSLHTREIAARIRPDQGCATIERSQLHRVAVSSRHNQCAASGFGNGIGLLGGGDCGQSEELSGVAPSTRHCGMVERSVERIETHRRGARYGR